MFKLMNFMWENRHKIKAFALFALVVNSAGLAYTVYLTGFDMSGLSFQCWLMTFVCFIIINIQYREEE